MAIAGSKTVYGSSSACLRQERAVAWLSSADPAGELVVIGATREAALEVIRLGSIGRSVFGWRALTLPVLARWLAEPALLERASTPAAPLALVAVAARATDGLGTPELGRYSRIADTPGFPRALARSLAEARAAGLGATELAQAQPELGALAAAFDECLIDESLVDSPLVLALATAAVKAGAHPLVGQAVVMVDVPIRSAREELLVRALVATSSSVLATIPDADHATELRLKDLFDVVESDGPGGAIDAEPTALERMQRELFGVPRAPSESDESVQIFSAPGISRECVEIARRALWAARNGVRFDRMAVLLRSPGEYQGHLDEALRRAGVPAHFARGVTRPDPSGRAIAALLRCRLEDLSARRFAEYLSVDELPFTSGQPPPARYPELWADPDDPDGKPALEETRESREDDQPSNTRQSPGGGEVLPVTVQAAPRRWERLLVEAAVVGGRKRWERRLRGLNRELALDLEALDDPDDPAAERIRADRAALVALSEFALPLLDDLAAWPAEALWRDHLDRLCALATRALRDPERVLSVASSLAPLGAVGPVSLREVVRVLDRYLLDLTETGSRHRYGALFVAPIESARGMSFDIVFVPGLAERVMPRKVSEEPLLLDSARTALSGELETNADRAENERLLLALAVGAARERVILSYPSLDTEMGRPKVPSFYTLEAMRAAIGVLPPIESLRREAAASAGGRLGWPAPEDPALAIDEAEYDLALLARMAGQERAQRLGAARYLLDSNPHLARALRARAQRWRKGWFPSDGLVAPGPAALDALSRHRLHTRSYSPTALQNFAACPYRFYLYAILRLQPREEPQPIDALDPLQRGSLIHDIQFELLTSLREAGKLPVSASNLAYARDELDRVLDKVAGAYEEDLSPAIPRVWKDGVESVRADLAEWLRRASEDDSGFVPWRFELTFGLPERRRTRDEHSVPEAVALDQGLRVRGSIDLVERRADGTLRVTDHKTGRARVRSGQVIAGGASLQPVLYALVAEKVFDARVEAGRLYFCTTAESFTETVVPLDLRARDAAGAVADAVDGAIEAGHLPAYPEKGACTWCDYRTVCGPLEETRTRTKRHEGLAGLLKLRARS